MYGNAGDDTLDGGIGADALIGGTGNDIYIVDNIGDVITENANEGIDTVKSSITYTLGATLENLTLTGTTAINGTGNSLNNSIAGNSANNIFDGDAGSDTLIGGLGNDTYIIDSNTDTLIENTNEGIDTVISSVNHTLKTNFENLTLQNVSTALNASGNQLVNVLTGNSYNNRTYALTASILTEPAI